MGSVRIGLLVGTLFTLFATVSGQAQSYKCDFESGPCSFLANAKINIVNWKPGRGRLNAEDTGPSVDHTYGNASGNYMYVNVTAAKLNRVSLETTVPLKDGYCVRFFYHMYGADIGDLKVTVEGKSTSTEYFSRSKTQGDRWKEAFFSVYPTNMMRSQGYKVVFTAKHQSATNVRGDIALDDIELTPGKCPDSKREADQLCSFDDYDCGYTSTRTTSLNWEWKSYNGNSDYMKNQPKEDHTLGTIAGGYWYAGKTSTTFFGGGFQSADLTSPLYKAPSDLHNCLHFYYYMDGDGRNMWGEAVKQAYLQAHLTFPNSKTGGQWLTTVAKNMTILHKQWTYVEVKANITTDYQLRFTVGLEGKAAALIALDDVKIVPGNCPESGDCDFEEGMCSWTDGEAEYSWLRKTGDSGTNREIGPATDKTKGTGKGNYVVFSTKNKNAGSVAVLQSGFFAPEDASRCLSFYYQMGGDDPGTLKIIRREELLANTTVWSLRGDQGPLGWKKGVVLLKPSTFMNQVAFTGISGKGKNGFMALDDIRMRTGEECQLTPPYADPRYETIDLLSCTFDDKSLCSWKQDQGTLEWKFGGFEQVKSTTPKQPANNQGYYIYVSSYEGIPQTNHELLARIQSPVVSASFNDTSCFSFYYNMFGANVGELTLSIVPLDGKGEPIGKQVIWRRSGSQPDRWFQYKDTMGITEGDYRVEIQGEMGPGFGGYFAVDDISLAFGACPNTDVCDFENGLCGWTVEAGKEGKFLWRRTVPTKLGPPRDHTSMTGAGYYLQAVNEQGASSNDVTNFVSPKYGKRWGAHCLTFWYWRPGQGNGSLSVLTRKESGQESQLWLADRDVGLFWHLAQVTVDEKEEVQVLIRAIKGNDEDKEMALDDIHIKNSRCGNPGSCSFNRDYCGYFLDAGSNFAWQLGDGRVVDDMKVDSTPQDNSVENGMYVYADMTSPVLKEGHYAMLVSEIINAPRQGTFCLTFFYHINGKDNCSLSVGKAMLDYTGDDILYKTQELFKINDSKGKGWETINFNVPVVWGALQQVYFQATRGNGSRAFLAVDDVTVVDGMCGAPTTSPPVTVTEMPVSVITCDFDNDDFCSWTSDRTERLKWQISNPRRLTDGMPKFDHTKGNYFGRYAYLKGEGFSFKVRGRLISEYKPKEWTEACFSFWYFINGETKDSLSVETLASRTLASSTADTIWFREGNYGYKWRHAYVHYKPKIYSSVLFAIVGTLKTGIIAVDDLAANNGSCPPSKMCTFDDDNTMCGFVQDVANDVDWDVKSGKDNDTLARMPDHTTQSLSGNYLYIGFNQTASGSSHRSRILSPKRPPSSIGSCVTFYYHIHNVFRMSLNTYLATDDQVSDPQWTASVDQGLQWHGARFSIVPKTVKWQVVFEATVGSLGYGQVAIDDIMITQGFCPDKGFCDFETEDCLWEDVRTPYDEQKPKVDGSQRDYKPPNLLDDDFDWVRHIAYDPFGPTADHTLGTPQGFYLLFDPRNAKPGEKAVYLSERLRTTSGVCLKFWYAIPNLNDGSELVVYSSNDFIRADQSAVFKNSTNGAWAQGQASVVPLVTADVSVDDFWIFLSGTAGKNKLSYIAIDDITIEDGTCTEVTTRFNCKNGQEVDMSSVCNFHKDCSNGMDERNCADCDFEEDSCGWTTPENFGYFRWQRSLGGREHLMFDHTKLDSSGSFIIADGSPGFNNNLKTTLNSAVLRNAFSTCSMEFWYSTYSNITMSINLIRSNRSVEIWVPYSRSEEIWTKGELYLGRIPSEFQINFVAIRERNFKQHAAVDDIHMDDCETLTLVNPSMCNADQFDCKNSRCIPRDYLCDYTDDCGNFEDEKQETCLTAVSRCSFDQSFCNWVVESSVDGGVWQRRKPFESLVEGPTRDHTTGSVNGQFLYVQGRLRPMPARILGPILEPAEGCQIRLYYDIRGAGPLSLQVKTRTEQNGEEKIVWTREDPTEGYYFVYDSITFTETQSYQVILEASVKISSRVNYIAVDDVSFNHKCIPRITPLPTVNPVVPTEPTKTCGGGQFKCRNGEKCIFNNMLCDFYEDCEDGSDEDHCGIAKLTCFFYTIRIS